MGAKFIESNHPAEKGLFAEDELLIIELKQRGFTVLNIPWRTPDINWNDYDFALTALPAVMRYSNSN
ncbi:hypothetical protein [Nostoc sp.]|uniref:hypothetical protein n=1 Tax=Nostoc sp. TaxID=1180 RepID=UPI002FFC88E0